MLTVNDALHAMTSDNVILVQFTYIPTEDERTYSIGEED